MTHDEMIGLFCPKVSATSIMAIEAFTKPQQGFTSGHQTSSMLTMYIPQSELLEKIYIPENVSQLGETS